MIGQYIENGVIQITVYHWEHAESIIPNTRHLLFGTRGIYYSENAESILRVQLELMHEDPATW